jgi:hypothetical protein
MPLPISASRPRTIGRLALVLACGAALAVPTGARGAASKRRVVVFPLRNLGVEEDVASSLLGFLRAEVAKLPGVTAVDLAKRGALVGANCRGELKCLAAAGSKLGADEVVWGTVAGVGGAYSVDLKRIAVRSAREAARVTETLTGEREGLIDHVRAAAYKLLVPRHYVGTIELDISEPGVEVFLDGKSAGTSPLRAPIANVAPGKHALKFVKMGYADLDRFVDVRFARATVVRVDLRKDVIAGVMAEQTAAGPAAPEPERAALPPLPPPPPIPKIPEHFPPGQEPSSWTGIRKAAAWTAAVGAAALIAAGVVGAFSARDRNRAIASQVTLPDGSKGPVTNEAAASLVRAAGAKATAANVLFGVGGTALGTGAVLYLAGGPRDAVRGVSPVVGWAGGGPALGLAGTF